MKLIDLSQPLWHHGPNCPAHPSPSVEISATHERDGWHMEQIAMASHTGSHLDAPLHKIAGGQSLSDLPLETFAGRAFLADLRPMQPNALIDAAMLSRTLPDELNDAIVLLATGWGDKHEKTQEWLYDSPHLSEDGARWLVEHRVRGVGIDHYTIGGSREPNNARVHEILLGASVWIVEELRFPSEAFAVAQPWRFWCLPINLRDASGAPCRPVIEVA